MLNSLGLGSVVPIRRSATMKTLLEAGRNQICTSLLTFLAWVAQSVLGELFAAAETVAEELLGLISVQKFSRNPLPWHQLG